MRTCESRRACAEGAWRARLLTTALLLGVVSVAGCTASSGATAHGTATAAGTASPAGVNSDCLLPPISCYAPALFRVEYGIQPLLGGGIDGRGETVTVPAVAPSPGAPANNATVAPPPGVTPASSERWIMPASGSSASASLWSGLMALADQDAHHDLGLVNPAIYRIARSSKYHQAFRDIITGSNVVNTPPAGLGGYQAGPGWDPATGWGSPDAQVLVPLLAA